MAKKQSGAPRDTFVNRYRGRVTWPADPSAPTVESFNTGMNVGRQNPMKWIVTGAWCQPATMDSWDANIGASGAMTFQVAIGTQTTTLNPDDMQVIGTAYMNWQYVAAGPGPEFRWPLVVPLAGPIPVFAQVISVTFETDADHAAVAGDMLYEIDYFTAPIDDHEIAEYLSAFGQV